MENSIERAQTSAAWMPDGPRVIRTYRGVVKSFDVAPAYYPFDDQTSFLPSIHELAYVHGILDNLDNFNEKSGCSVLEIFWLSDTTGTRFLSLRNLYWTCFDDWQVTAKLLKTRDPTVVTRVIFLKLRNESKASFGRQVLLPRDATLAILKALHVSPQYCSLMFGDPDYGAPFHAKVQPYKRGATRREFVAQYPRYGISQAHSPPCSVYLTVDITTQTTNYIVSFGENEQWVEDVNDRLKVLFESLHPLGTPLTQALQDPLLVQSILCHESMRSAELPTTTLRHHLYDVLDSVKTFSNQSPDRQTLRDTTELLHNVSQSAEALSASADMGIMVAQHSLSLWQALQHDIPNPNSVEDSLNYIVQSLESQKRWLQSYKARKDIAMNLIFNLVTQQNSELSMSIARDTKDDSASMKIIAAMTMVFLPATAVAGVFGMSFFNMADDGKMIYSSQVWLFAAVTVPLTIVITLTWLMWYPLVRLVNTVRPRQRPPQDFPLQQI